MKLLFLIWMVIPVSLLAEGGLPNQPYIYVEGQAEIEKPADVVTLRFDYVARNTDQIKANREAQSRTEKILALLDDRKIAQKDVIASEIKSEPQYEREEAGRHSKVIGYVVTRPVSVKLRDINSLPKLVDDLTAFGVEFSGIEAGISNEQEVQQEVWKQSLANAREQAEKTLREFGMKVDSVFAVSPVAFPRITEKIFGEREQVVATGSYISEKQAIASQYRLPPVKVSQSVHVIYLVSPAK